MGFGFVAFPGLMAAVNAMCASSGGCTLPSLSAGDFGWPIGSCSSNMHFTGTEVGGGRRRMRSERILRGGLDAMMMHGSEEGEGDDYTFIDCGAGKRIERFGGVLVTRPCPAATWRCGLGQESWAATHLEFTAPSLGGQKKAGAGGWVQREDMDMDWVQKFPSVGITFTLSKAEQGQVGVFPEQLENWEWIQSRIRSCHGAERGKEGQGGGGGEGERWAPFRVLNGFAYTGGSTLAAAAAVESMVGVVHLDGAKGSVAWAKRNAEASNLGQAKIRWLCEDVTTFIDREIKRGSRYEGLIFDPPAFGRGGPKNRVWSLDTDLPLLASKLPKLLSSTPSFVLVSCHDRNWPHDRLASLLSSHLPKGRIESGELVIEAQGGGKPLPNGVFARWSPG